MPKKRCFVVQGFGKKQDYQSGRTLDLDASYEVIKEAVTAAGLVCVRADEIKHSGTIDKPMFEQILDADLVIADLSTYNVNAAYELGVRHALRPFSTIIVAEKGFNYPFDFSHIAIRNYEHLGPDIGRKEAKRFQEELSQAIQTILSGSQEDSPVYTFIPDLQPPGRAAMAAATAAATTAAPAATASLKEMMDRAKAAMRASDFDTAKVVLAALHALAPSDNAITQSLALATYKSGKPTAEAALLEAMQLLSALAPTTSHDTETLGLWGAVHKRLWDLTKDPPYLDEAIRGYERGFQLRQDYYNGINLAFLLNLRAQIAQPADAIADWVVAGRVRRRVVEICAVEMASLTGSTAALSDEERRSNLASQYWVLATLREAAVGLEDEVAAEHWRVEAAKTEPADWMVKTTDEQVGRLKVLLGNSPLRQLQPLSP